jgi:hypothetical protein
MRARNVAFILPLIVLVSISANLLAPNETARADGLSPQMPASTQFSLDGLVMTPASYDRAALASFPQSTLTVGGATYTGVSLWTLLSKASIITHPEIKNDVLREAVVATASDGYKVIISLGEIDPDFGNQPCLIATQQNGADFASGGFARLVFPNDVKKGRWVVHLTSLKIAEIP